MENTVEDIREIDTLIAELEISKNKGNLILCVVNSPSYRNRIIKDLRRRFSLEVIDVKKGTNIPRKLRRNLGYVDVLVWIMPEEATDDLLNTLNNFRELFYEVKKPNIIFYNQSFSESVIRKAPDFWRYRGNYYELKETEKGMTYKALEAITTSMTYKDKEDLLRRRRINEYLLNEIKDSFDKTKILNELGEISYVLGEYDKALEYAEKSLKINKEIGRKDRITADLANIGNIYVLKGEVDRGLKYYQDALKINREIGYKQGEADTLNSIGDVYLEKGATDDGLKYCQEALRINREIGYKKGEARVLGSIGEAYRQKGELDNALKYHLDTLKIFREIGYRIGEGRALDNLGLVYARRGELDKALQFYVNALNITREVGYRQAEARILTDIGHVFLDRGELDNALKYHLDALKINREIGYKQGEANSMGNIGIVYMWKGDLDNASKYLQDALKIVDSANLTHGRDIILKSISAINKARTANSA
jgi:tetratricopeptide (TPR) repeat protein